MLLVLVGIVGIFIAFLGHRFFQIGEYLTHVYTLTWNIPRLSLLSILLLVHSALSFSVSSGIIIPEYEVSVNTMNKTVIDIVVPVFTN